MICTRNNFKYILSFAILLLFNKLCNPVFAIDTIPHYYIENIKQHRKDVSNQYGDIQPDSRGILYFASPDGIYEYDGYTWKLIPVENNKGAYSLAIDKTGCIYSGGRGTLGYLKPAMNGEMKYISLNEKLPGYFKNYNAEIVDIQIAGDKITFLTDNFIFILDGFKADSFDVIQAPSFFYSSVVIDTSLYIMDEMQGLMKMQDDHFEPIPGGEYLVSYVMFPYSNNKAVIVSPNKGLIFFNAEDNSLNYLSGVNSDIAQYDIKSGITLYNGTLALGSLQYGLIITDSLGNQLYTIDQKNGLQNNSVYNLVQDVDGNIWLGLVQGISLIYDRIAQQPADIKNIEPFRAFVRKVEDRKRNSVLFAGTFTNELANRILHKQEDYQVLKLSQDQNGLRFSFSSNQYYNTTEVYFQYYLEGLEETWGHWRKENLCEYTNLGGNSYTLHVRAKNELGEVSREACYTFKVKVPWYSSWWFYTLQISVLVLMLAIASLLYKYGKSRKLAGNISGIVVVIVFKYIYLALGPLFAALATGIVVFDILTSVVVAYIISPAKEFTNKILEKLMVKNADRKTNNKIEIEQEKSKTE